MTKDPADLFADRCEKADEAISALFDNDLGDMLLFATMFAAQMSLEIGQCRHNLIEMIEEAYDMQEEHPEIVSEVN